MNKSSSKDVFLKCKDHTVSGEVFELHYHHEYDMLVTTPKPAKENLHKYYESEDYISHTDAKRSMFEKVYHLVKKYSLRNKVRLISDLKGKGSCVLDIGAGTGDFLLAAKKKGWIVSGTEPNERARSLAENKGVAVEENTSDLKSNTFDIITMWHVLEHVPDLHEQLKELKRLIKPGGYIIVAVPNYKSYDATFYGAYWAAYDVPRHLWHFSKNSIQKLFDENKMSVMNTIPMIFDSFYVSLLSEKYKHGKMNYSRAFGVGIKSNLTGVRTKQYSSHIYVIKNE